ncbi:MAG: beta strand repeat-containing protein [Methyloceanibacter sp.]|uniref:beta strand repeat-containing protein n=1 Tax=Methyloceanibacter sp. TaxID=1965321 RepID=UPI003D6D67F2
MAFFGDSAAGDTTTFTVTGSMQFGSTFGDTATAGNSTINSSKFLLFAGDSTAGTATITHSGLGVGLWQFVQNATAGQANITNSGQIWFSNNTSASDSTIDNTGNLQFFDDASGGNAQITTSGVTQFVGSSTAENATIINTNTGQLYFMDSASAGNATITNNNFMFVGQANLAQPQQVTLANATIENNNLIFFFEDSTAGNATITTTGGAVTDFDDNSTGGNARFITELGGTVDFSGSTGLTGTNQVSAGSIAGAGNYILGANELTVGSNNLSSEASGVISGTGGSLVKVGTGSLTLSGINTYTGPTNVAAGQLIVNGSLDPISDVTVNNGATLGGSGMVGVVDVNAGGILAPGASAGMLQTDDLTFAGTPQLRIELGGSTAGTGYDQVNVAGNATLANAVLSVSRIGGFDPAAGTTFRILDNDDNDAISGIFTGRPDGSTFLTGGRKYTIDYDGGDGNDLVLTIGGAVINGTSASNVINASTTVAGQPHPTTVADSIDAKGGNDKVDARAGNDTIFGGSGKDTLKGGDGNDVITGGAHHDLLYGGSGSDDFDFNKISESKKGSQRDKINHFQRNQDDIDLRDIDAKGGVSGNQKFKWIGKDDFSETKGELRYEDNGSKVIVQGDVNGDGKADFEIFVAVGSLAKGDFLL